VYILQATTSSIERLAKFALAICRPAPVFLRAGRMAVRLSYVLWAGLFLLSGATSFGLAQSENNDVVAFTTRIAGDVSRTRFVTDLSQNVEFVLFPLADPYRLVIDLPKLRFDLPAGSGKQGRGLISSYRWGEISNNKSRMVLDLVGPVKVESTFMIPALDDQPARLVIDLIETDRDTFLNEQVSELFGTSADNTTGLDVQIEAVQGGPEPDDQSASVIPVIVIDPGHGGVDSGAVGADQTLEKEIVLAFSLSLAEELRRGGRVNPVLTRTTDEFLSLAQRVKIARDNKAALFISIHADSVAEPEVNGATVYTLSKKASDRVAERLANKENRSDLIGGVAPIDASEEVEDILLNLMSRETKFLSQNFARELVNTLSKTVKLIKNPNRSAAFKVLEAPDIPSILLELGYISNADDEARLKSRSWQDRATAAIAVAIEAYIRAY
jgi:N-acetylmuramoyl-L-alanine amidase